MIIIANFINFKAAYGTNGLYSSIPYGFNLYFLEIFKVQCTIISAFKALSIDLALL